MLAEQGCLHCCCHQAPALCLSLKVTQYASPPELLEAACERGVVVDLQGQVHEALLSPRDRLTLQAACLTHQPALEDVMHPGRLLLLLLLRLSTARQALRLAVGRLLRPRPCGTACGCKRADIGCAWRCGGRAVGPNGAAAVVLQVAAALLLGCCFLLRLQDLCHLVEQVVEELMSILHGAATMRREGRLAASSAYCYAVLCNPFPLASQSSRYNPAALLPVASQSS